MAAKRGDSKKIIVGAAQVFVADEPLEYFTVADDGVAANGHYFPGTIDTTEVGLPAWVSGTKYVDTLSAAPATTYWDNVGFTTNGLELSFEPDFGEVKVDQLLDVAKLYKQGMKVTLKTAFAEATLENLLIAIAASGDDLSGTTTKTLNLTSGDLGECPVERALVAVGPGTGDCSASGNDAVERIYAAYRVLSIDNVTVGAKRDEATTFEVTFRLLPAADGAYGKIVDRVVSDSGS